MVFFVNYLTTHESKKSQSLGKKSSLPPPHLRKPYLPSEESTPEEKHHPFLPPPPYYKISPATMLFNSCTIINNVKKMYSPHTYVSRFFNSTFLPKNHYLNWGEGGGWGLVGFEPHNASSTPIAHVIQY